MQAAALAILALLGMAIAGVVLWAAVTGWRDWLPQLGEKLAVFVLVSAGSTALFLLIAVAGGAAFNAAFPICLFLGVMPGLWAVVES